jgi:hypothetical protein
MSYQVKPGEGEVTVYSGASRKLQFTVNNTSDRPILTQTEVRVGGAVDPKWCSVDPAADTNLEPKGSRTFTVTIAPKDVTTMTSGHVQLAAASVDDPSNATPSPQVRVIIQPAQVAPTWWQRYGKHVLIGSGAAVLVTTVITAILLRPRDLALAAFEATPAGGASAGEPIRLSWKLEGKPDSVYLTLGNDEDMAIPEELWEEGPFEITSLIAGPLKVCLNAKIDSDVDEGASPEEVSDTLDLEITEGAGTFEPADITSFTVAQSSPTAGQPVRFDWKTTGDVLMLTIICGPAGWVVVTDPARLASGSHEQPFLAGTHRVGASVTGKGSNLDYSDTLSIVVTENESLKPPQVDLSAKATGGMTLSDRAPNLTVSWNVDGEHTDLELMYLAHDATPKRRRLATNIGELTFRGEFVPVSSNVILHVGRGTGPKFVYECEVGGSHVKGPPKRLTFSSEELDYPFSFHEEGRIMHVAVPKGVIRLVGN